MDFISQLIEQNTVRAIAINQVLVKNETQLHHIEKEQESMDQQNTYISQILNSWSSFLNRIWNYSGKKLLSPLKSQFIKENNTEKQLVSLESEDVINSKESLSTEELTYLEKMAPLKEMTKNISQNLDRQNEMLHHIKNKNVILENQIQDNQNKIKQILES